MDYECGQVFAILLRPLALMSSEIVAKDTTERRRVLIVTNLMSGGIIKERLQINLTGLVLTFHEEGPVEHQDFVNLIKKTCRL